MPLSYNDINNQHELFNKHLLHKYSIYTGKRGTNSPTGPTTINGGKLTIDLTGSSASISFSNSSALSEISTLKIYIKYMSSYKSGYTILPFTLIQNGTMQNMLSDAMKSTFIWYFTHPDGTDTAYTMSIERIEYKLKNSTKLFALSEVQIKYANGNIVIQNSSWYGVSAGLNANNYPNVVSAMRSIGCIHFPDSWNAFHINGIHTFYSNSITMNKLTT